MSALRDFLPLSLLLLLGCEAPPPGPRSQSLPQQIQRIAAAEFGPTAGAKRQADLVRSRTAMHSELDRLSRFQPAWRRYREAERQRFGAPARRGELLLRSELQRWEQSTARIGNAATGDAPQRSTAKFLEGLARIPEFLGLEKPPLSHPKDREFRVVPQDELPEAGLWERLRQRLPF